MYFAPFREEFEELGFKETRCVFAGKSLDFPEGEYCFEELFCVEPFCDCRIVRFIVMNQEGKEQAQITWVWEKKSFYDKEFGFSDHNFPGPDLAAMAP